MYTYTYGLIQAFNKIHEKRCDLELSRDISRLLECGPANTSNAVRTVYSRLSTDR